MNKKAWLCALTFSLLIVTLLFVGQEINMLLRYSREGIHSFELWRLITGHIVHSNVMHGIINVSAFLLILFVVGTQFSVLLWSIFCFSLAIFTSLALWFFVPELAWYVGFSGVLHGLLAGGLLSSTFKGDKIHGIVFVLVLAKVMREQWFGVDGGYTQSLIGVPVIVDAHLFGFIGGSIFFMLYRIFQHLLTRS